MSLIDVLLAALLVFAAVTGYRQGLIAGVLGFVGFLIGGALGLVVAVDGDDVRFIHSTTSRGVIVSSLREGFWNHAFVKATRVF